MTKPGPIIEHEIIPREHHYLCFLDIIYMHEKKGRFGHETNSLLLTKSRNINAQDINRLQSGSIKRFANENPEILKDHRIMNVIIKSFNYLGHMTQEEFTGKS